MIYSSFGQFESLTGRTPINITIGSDISLLRGTPLTIICPVRGVPMPKIIWAKDRSVLTSNDRMDMDCNGTLRIRQVSIEDTGEYICTADSFLGMDMAFTSVVVLGQLKNQSI